MNKNSKKGAIGEGKSTERGGLIQQDTEGAIQYIKKNNTNTNDEGEDYNLEIDKTEFKESSYKDYNSKSKEEGGKKK